MHEPGRSQSAHDVTLPDPPDASHRPFACRADGWPRKRAWEMRTREILRAAKRVTICVLDGCRDVQNRLYPRDLLSHEHLTLPSFLGIGAQKSGTTWLYANLRCHPELYLPDNKEVHYLDRHYYRGLRWYAAHFRNAGGRLAGEITPAYAAISPERIRFVHAVMPNLRLLFLLRNPVDRAWSQAVSTLLRRPSRKLADLSEREIIAHLQSDVSLKRGSYINCLDNWLAVYPADRLFVGYFEDVAERPLALLSAVLAHLGVSRNPDWERFPYRQMVNKGLRTPMPRAIRTFLQEMYRAEIEALYQRFGEPVREWRC